MTDLGTWRPTAHDREGQRCRCFECAPLPTISVDEALRSIGKRHERDLQIARRLRMAPDEVEPFLFRLALYDVREEARVEEEAAARLDRTRWTRLRGKGVSLRLPRPRAA